MKFTFNDGGREAAGYKGLAGDCACRAIAIVTGLSYQAVYDRINELAKSERKGKRKTSISHARNGVYRKIVDVIMKEQGYSWMPTMKIGSGCKVHLIDGEIPMDGKLLVVVSRHYTAVIDGVINDTHNPDRNGSAMGVVNGVPFRKTTGRCVYGYFYKGNENNTQRKKEIEGKETSI